MDREFSSNFHMLQGSPNGIQWIKQHENVFTMIMGATIAVGQIIMDQEKVSLFSHRSVTYTGYKCIDGLHVSNM